VKLTGILNVCDHSHRLCVNDVCNELLSMLRDPSNDNGVEKVRRRAMPHDRADITRSPPNVARDLLREPV